VVADALSRLHTEVSSTTASSKQIAELYENLDDKSPDQKLIQHQQRHPEYFSKTVDGHEVILCNNKIYIPKALGSQY
jgi:hypothetical protein